MQSLLGRIIAIESDDTRHKITFEPLCTLPDRKAPPEHLKNQKLTFERLTQKMPDAREIGEVGGSIVLRTSEARIFLQPLNWLSRRRLSSLSGDFSVELYWWKDETPPNWTARLGGKSTNGAWEKHSFGWSCVVPLRQLSAQFPPAPFDIEFTCGELQRKCTVISNEVPRITAQHETQDTVYSIKNLWLDFTVTPRNGGAVESLYESDPGKGSLGKRKSGRNIGRAGFHFFSRNNRIQHPLDWAGHTDRFRTGWGEWNSMRDVKMEVMGASREANTSRVTMQGEIEDGLRTQFSATLLDDWPLLLMRREFSLHPKKEEKKDEGEPKQPIDEMRLFQTGFRCAVAPDKAASRVWCRADGETVPFSLARENEHQSFWHWKMEEGFALFEQAQRREWLLYFFDPDNAPHLGLWRGPHAATLEPFWAGVPLKPGQSIGSSLGLAAGESGGVNEHGAWVACRAKRDDQWHCALLARCEKANPQANLQAVFSINETQQPVPLTALFLPGIGTVYGATAQFPVNEKSDVFTAELESLQGGVA
ncbi:MAG TPA: hypothetical protein VGB77_06300 [Abditibacteriaceae bacterium]